MEEREFHGIENEVCFRENKLKVLWDSWSTHRFETLFTHVFCNRIFINKMVPLSVIIAVMEGEAWPQGRRILICK